MKVRPDRSAVAVVLTSGGFPSAFESGHTISGIERAGCVPGTHVFHNCTEVGKPLLDCPTPTSRKSGGYASRRSSSGALHIDPSNYAVVTAGGPVLTVTAVGR